MLQPQLITLAWLLDIIAESQTAEVLKSIALLTEKTRNLPTCSVFKFAAIMRGLGFEVEINP